MNIDTFYYKCFFFNFTRVRAQTYTCTHVQSHDYIFKNLNDFVFVVLIKLTFIENINSVGINIKGIALIHLKESNLF